MRGSWSLEMFGFASGCLEVCGLGHHPGRHLLEVGHALSPPKPQTTTPSCPRNLTKPHEEEMNLQTQEGERGKTP